MTEPKYQFPRDLKPQWYQLIKDWFNVARRLQSVSRKQNGHAILKILVLVNQDGKPLTWSNPKTILLEPKDRIDGDTIKMFCSNPEVMQVFDT